MPKERSSDAALYVRLPAAVGGKLDRAAEKLGMAKKDLIAGLVSKYVDPDTRQGLAELNELPQPPRVVETAEGSVVLGTASFQAHEPLEVLTAKQASQLLQLPEATLIELAECGELPGRKLGTFWRFSRTALLEWLSTAPSPKPRSKRRGQDKG